MFFRVVYFVDGVFGRCQELAGADLYTYDISPSALQRLRILLQKLAHRGTVFSPVCLGVRVFFYFVEQPLSVVYSAYSNACQLPLYKASQIAKLSLWPA